MSRLLYYPSISIPNEPWLIQALLYWDEVATIVPMEYLQYPQKFTPFARQLLREGAIQAVPPEEYAYSNPRAYNDFLRWVEDNNDPSLVLPINSGLPLYNLHVGKVGLIGEELELRGLARRGNNQWYEVSPRLAQAFMTFLAVLIGLESDYVPTTDVYRGFADLLDLNHPHTPTQAKKVRNALRTSILDAILPVPSSVKEWADILRFKERHGDALQRFRRHIEGFILSLDGSSPEIQEECCRGFVANAQEEIEELRGQMRWFRAPEISMGTFAAALPSAIELAAGNTAMALAGLPSIILDLIHNPNRRTEIRKPLAYAALYRNKWRINRNLR